MDGLSSQQQKVVNDVIHLLHTHGVDPKFLQTLLSSPEHDEREEQASSSQQNPSSLRHDECDGVSSSQPKQCIEIERASYVPPKAVDFTVDERARRLDQVTRVGYATALLDHPEGAVLEYPESGKVSGESVAHRFTITPRSYIHPKENIQYSLGGIHGGNNDMKCYMLRDPVSGKPLQCSKIKYGCTS